ncbi:Uncharacterised protein [Burkholderia pseudomallei]|nr:Uncharacterised protein [Burkholderia pseudomallei]
MSSAKRPPNLAEMARQSQMKNVYDMLYGFLSVFAHGIAPDLIVKTNGDGLQHIAAILPLGRGCLQGLHVISLNLIRHQRATDRSELESVLKVRLTD